MSIALRPLFAVAAVLAFAAPIAAQEVAFADAAHESAVEVPGTVSAIVPGPTAAGAALMVPLAVTSFDAVPAVLAMQERASHNVALMIVGGAGLVVGSLVGGDAGTVIMIGGGVVLLVGLYRYLR